MLQRIKLLSYALMLISGSNPQCADCGQQILIRNGDGPDYKIVTTRCFCAQCEAVFSSYDIEVTRDFGSMPNNLLELHRMASRGFGPPRVSALACEFTPVPRSIKVMRKNSDGEKSYFVVSLGRDYGIEQSPKKKDPRDLTTFINTGLGIPWNKPNPIFTDELDDPLNVTYNSIGPAISTTVNAVKWTERLIEVIEEKRRALGLQELAKEDRMAMVKSDAQKKPAVKPAPVAEDAPRKITWE